MRYWLVVLLILTVISFAVPELTYADHLASQIEQGDYLSIKYIDVLEKTRSPLLAEGGRPINLVVVQGKQDATEVLPIINFHEGVPVFIVRQSGITKVKGTSSESDVSGYSMKIVNSEKIVVGSSGVPPQEFVFVKDLGAFVCSKSIAGRYVDGDGQSYEFKANGIAITPTTTFNFVIGTDHVPYRFDYLEDSITHQVYRFSREGCNLDISEVLDAVENQHGNDGSHIRPFAKLREVGCKKTQ
jgi:hypothetical protein